MCKLLFFKCESKFTDHNGQQEQPIPSISFDFLTWYEVDIENDFWSVNFTTQF